jgi:hypothetical protein
MTEIKLKIKASNSILAENTLCFKDKTYIINQGEVRKEGEYCVWIYDLTELIKVKP